MKEHDMLEEQSPELTFTKWSILSMVTIINLYKMGGEGILDISEYQSFLGNLMHWLFLSFYTFGILNSFNVHLFCYSF